MSYEKLLDQTQPKTLFNKLTRTHLIIIGAVGVLATTIVIGTVIITTRSSKPSNFSKLRIPSVKIEWKQFHSDSVSLENAFVGGTKSNGKSVYVCRVNSTVAPEVLPGTYDPTRGTCEMTWGGKAFSLSKFDLLTTNDPSSLVWIHNKNGMISSGSVIAGLSSDRDEIAISRSIVSGNEYIGKVHSRHKKAYVPVSGLEKELYYYEVLCIEDHDLKN